MKKYASYIIAASVVVFLAALVFLSSRGKLKQLDERITLRQADKIPYGTSAAKSLLPSLFPDASIYFNKAYPADWDSISPEDSNQAVILLAKHFNADEEELSRLLNFARAGNYVFIVARSFSYSAVDYFHFSYNENSLESLINTTEDSLRIKLEKPAFGSDQLFVYPGRKYESAFYTLDTMHTRVLGRTQDGKPNFIQLPSGKGSLFIHVAPLAFSNYFILHKDNIRYFQDALSVLPGTVEKVLWNEYYLVKPRDDGQGEPNWLGVLMKYPAFKWGLLTGMGTLFLFVLLGMRRRQRLIPEYHRPRNDSLDFVKTIGRLYYDRKDHKNLAKKMATYFLDHVRTTYKLPTHTLDDAFIQNLHFKSGFPLEEINEIIRFIYNLDSLPALTEPQLAHFHRQLELFYQNT